MCQLVVSASNGRIACAENFEMLVKKMATVNESGLRLQAAY